jgi:hypothetical protein
VSAQEHLVDDVLKQETLRVMDTLVHAEDAAKGAPPAAHLSQRTLDALQAARVAVEADMDGCIAGVKDPENGQTIEAHQALRQTSALLWILGQLPNAAFVEQVAAHLLAGLAAREAN